MKKLLLPIIFLVTFVFSPVFHTQAMDEWCGGRNPHGNYCESSEWGWYGAKKSVRTADEAKRILLKYFSAYKNIRVGNIKEKGWFFEAEIRDNKNVLIDRVIVDKRTGRIRSIY